MRKFEVRVAGEGDGKVNVYCFKMRCEVNTRLISVARRAVKKIYRLNNLSFYFVLLTDVSSCIDYLFCFKVLPRSNSRLGVAFKEVL